MTRQLALTASRLSLNGISFGLGGVRFPLAEFYYIETGANHVTEWTQSGLRTVDHVWMERNRVSCELDYVCTARQRVSASRDLFDGLCGPWSRTRRVSGLQGTNGLELMRLQQELLEGGAIRAGAS